MADEVVGGTRDKLSRDAIAWTKKSISPSGRPDTFFLRLLVIVIAAVVIGIVVELEDMSEIGGEGR